MTPLMGADLNNIFKTQRLSDDHVQFLVYQILRGLKVSCKHSFNLPCIFEIWLHELSLLVLRFYVYLKTKMMLSDFVFVSRSCKLVLSLRRESDLVWQANMF